jgi:hypothetical protein
MPCLVEGQSTSKTKSLNHTVQGWTILGPRGLSLLPVNMTEEQPMSERKKSITEQHRHKYIYSKLDFVQRGFDYTRENTCKQSSGERGKFYTPCAKRAVLAYEQNCCFKKLKVVTF